jgi:hypothetical protein
MDRTDERLKIVNDILAKCSVWNSFQGLEQFEEFASLDPDDAFTVAVDRITNEPDPDEGQLFGALLRIMRRISLGRLQSWVHDSWGSLSRGSREAIIYGAYDDSFLPIADWICLFVDVRSTVRDRHMLLAQLSAGGYRDRFALYAQMCMRMIDRYSDDSQNVLLEECKGRVVGFYGLSMADE